MTSTHACSPSIWANTFREIPTIIVQNMAGASSMITANYVYNVAKPDGLTFGIDPTFALLRSARGKIGSAI